jgi:predicted metal-dependent hydrolase
MIGHSIQHATQAAIEEGLRRFAKGLFWDAHEAWEEAWLSEEGTVKLGLQGLIQMTAAFHKGYRMNNPRAMLTLLQASIEKLHHVSQSDEGFAGIDMRVLLRDLRSIAEELGAMDARRGLPGPPLVVRCR